MTHEYASPAIARRRRVRRIALMALVLLVVVVLVVVAFLLYASCDMTTYRGGASCAWDRAPWVARDIIRGVWSSLTGQPVTKDLFPN
jgi:hypothetical protein